MQIEDYGLTFLLTIYEEDFPIEELSFPYDLDKKFSIDFFRDTCFYLTLDCHKHGVIDIGTYEINEKMVLFIKENISFAGYEERIILDDSLTLEEKKDLMPKIKSISFKLINVANELIGKKRNMLLSTLKGMGKCK